MWDDFRNFQLIQCYEGINLEYEIATLETNVRTRSAVHNVPCQMVKKSEVEFESQEKGVEKNIDEILSFWNRTKPIQFQDAEIKCMILKLQEKVKKYHILQL